MGWKRNPWIHLYQWIKYMKQEGMDEGQMLKAFETCPATKMDPNNQEEITFAKILINDALGKLQSNEIDKYILPSEVVGFKPSIITSEGYVFEAITPSDEENFLFLVDKDVFKDAKNIDEVAKRLSEKSAQICELVLYRFHTRNPYGLSGTTKVAMARISKDD